jgi:very-short-patch-repair endonuclease
MTPSDAARIEQFITRWQNSSGNERANYQMFFSELCDALGVKRPDVKGSVTGDPYCFDKDITIFHPSGKKTPGYIDFYKADHFLIEAKQGSNKSGKGTAKRGTNSYLKAMEAAFVQAIAYTRNLPSKPPFLLTCDIGDHFELWMGFSADYGGYGARQDIGLAALRKPEIFDLFVDIFTDPQKRNPEKIAAKVTREVAADLAELARKLERSPHPQSLSRGEKEDNLVPLLLGEKGLGDEGRPQQVAHFLMRCIFTMFAEDVGLLKEHLFTDALETRWLTNPKSFKPEVEALWQAMNDGTSFGFYGRLLRFNGGLFAEARAFELTADQLRVLLTAAKREWKDVEPAIFGTLLERALDSKERSKLGAHYTPRSYVERLVRPVVMEPLREQWDLVQGEVKQILGDVEKEPTAAQKKKAVAALEGFLTELRQVRILDPACGSGNFLYVTLDLIKQLESEVLRRLEDVTGQAQLRLDIAQVNPSQFLGIEINPRAAAIADLVIWIGYLQWHFRQFGDIPPVEPVLREYKNIECRDAVLVYDGKEEEIDPKTGKVRTRWGGRMMKHPVTGEMVPDPSDRIPIYRYINPRPAEWQKADYVVGNPPFIGNKRMKLVLGNGYTNALRYVWKYVPESADFVMYWWNKAALLVNQGTYRSFGLITTNSLTQSFNKRVVEAHISSQGILTFAIPDHPWVDSADGAQVRVAMTVFTQAYCLKRGRLVEVILERGTDEGEAYVELQETIGEINSDLSVGPNLSKLKRLLSNQGLSCPGIQLSGQGFIIPGEEINKFTQQTQLQIIRRYLIGRDLTQTPNEKFIIDTFGLSEVALQIKYPDAYQWLLERVKPARDQNPRRSYSQKWWLHAETRATFRPGIASIKRYIATCRTAKHRVFTFLSSDTLPDAKIVFIALEDAYYIGILSSQIHIIWALRSGAWLGVGNDSNYNHSDCFSKFPFPDPTPEQKQKIRELGERLDAHRKRVQAQHPDVTITAMYNLLEKIRAGEELSDKDREFNNKALVSTLKQIHDELDVAVFEAYGWEDLISPSPLTPRPLGEGNRNLDRLPSPLGRRAGDEGISKLAGRTRQIPEALLQRARELRQRQTPAEKLLWECLRDRRLYDAKFRRQHNLGQFIADFYCHAARLVIELDGKIHQQPQQQHRDSDRDQWMQANGFTVLRFRNEEVFSNTEAVLETIAQVLPSPLTPLPKGEGNRNLDRLPSPLGRRAGDEGKSTEHESIDEIILERLVALNAERAEEERNGFIRWLRPEYQAPGEVHIQQVIEGIAEVKEETAIAPVEQQKFPKAFKDQLAAVRDLLRTQGGEWTVEQIAAQFKGASRQKQTILTCLESLEALGIIAKHEEEGSDSASRDEVVRWYLAELQKAG